ncbi:MAG: AgmX/PglI C-terminal domain-containing protein [Myxococcales bacterium]|nr:AgmX/PglI C-terminal domain-containing protein [Myxococcales bacterium]
MPTRAGDRYTSAPTLGPRMREAIEDRSRRAIEVVTLFEDTILDVRHLVEPAHAHAPDDPFTIGPDPAATINVPGGALPITRFPLVRWSGGDPEISFTPSMGGDVTTDGRERVLADLVAEGRATPCREVAGAFTLALDVGMLARVILGDATFLVRAVPAPRRHKVPLRLDSQALVSLGIAVSACSLFLALVFSLPPDAHSLSLDPTLGAQRMGHFILKPPEEKPQDDELPKWLAKKPDSDGGGKGRRAAGPEGKLGNPKSNSRSGLFVIKGPKSNPDPQLARVLAEERARSIGLVGILRQESREQGSPFASIFAPDSALGDGAETVLGGLIGTQVADAFGCPGCMGMTGTLRGGGGTGSGTIGLGDLGRIGPGGGGGPKIGWGRGPKGLAPGDHRPGGPDDEGKGIVTVRGNALPKEIIRRVIRRHINEVRFCYEKELAKRPSLAGRVTVQFAIAGMGQVISSTVQQSTLNSPPVETCITGAVRRWEFPRPEGGGLVMVSYPFVLHAVGAEQEPTSPARR